MSHLSERPKLKRGSFAILWAFPIYANSVGQVLAKLLVLYRMFRYKVSDLKKKWVFDTYFAGNFE